MKFLQTLFLLSSALFLAGCSSMKVTSEQTADFDFSQINSYEWVRAPDKILDEEDTYENNQLLKAIDEQFMGRGWNRVYSSDQADILVTYYVKLTQHEEYTTAVDNGESRVTGGFTYKQETGSWGYNDHAPDINVYTIEEGTLTLLLTDAETGERLWKGTLKTRIDRSTPLEKQNKVFRKVARKIMTKVPGAPK